MVRTFMAHVGREFAGSRTFLPHVYRRGVRPVHMRAEFADPLQTRGRSVPGVFDKVCDVASLLPTACECAARQAQRHA